MSLRTIDQIEALIGEKIRAYRLDQNLSQDEVASKAGISRGALLRLEAGQHSSLHIFLRVLKALELDDWFDTLAPIPAINPLLMVQDQPRRRARRRKAPDGP
jgi:transcriptional regulator with XRE-family HTH domain